MPLHKGSSVCFHIHEAALVFILQALSCAPFLARKRPWFPSKLSAHTNQYYKTLRFFSLKIHYAYYGLSLSSWTECRLPSGRNWALFTPVSLGPAHSQHGSLQCEWKWTDLCSGAHSLTVDWHIVSLKKDVVIHYVPKIPASVLRRT